MFIQISILLFLANISIQSKHYEPNWASLDTRPLPRWYDEAKIGIFLHWGVFSVPSFGSEWFWQGWASNGSAYVKFMEKNYPPSFTYPDFASMFHAEFYDPEEWAEIFAAAGAKYVVLTSKHHEGFTLWPSKHSWNWNAVDVGPNRDLLGDLAKAIRSKTPEIHFGVYHSLFEWYNPLYLRDKLHLFQTNDFVKAKTLPELHELVNEYRAEIIWSDGDWEAPDIYWNATHFLAWLFNESPVKETVVVNDRWGVGIPCHHGSFYNCKDRYNPGVLQKHKWENAMTLDKRSWGFRRNAQAEDYHTIEELLEIMAQTISCGGNLLINTGPTREGKIAPIMEERLRQMGSWLKINGQAIYASKPWKYQNDTYTPGVWYTQKDDVFALVLRWPNDDLLTLRCVEGSSKSLITMLGYQKPLMKKQTSKGLQVAFPSMSQVKSKWAWVLKMKNVLPSKDCK